MRVRGEDGRRIPHDDATVSGLSGQDEAVDDCVMIYRDLCNCKAKM